MGRGTQSSIGWGGRARLGGGALVTQPVKGPTLGAGPRLCQRRRGQMARICVLCEVYSK